MDFVHLGSALSLRSKNFLGSAFTVFGTSRFGSSCAILDFVNLGSAVSLRSFGRLGSGLAVLDFLHLGSSLSLRSSFFPLVRERPAPQQTRARLKFFEQ